MLPVKTDMRKTTTAAEKEVPSVSRPLKKESKCPKELDPLGGSSAEEGSAISVSTSPSKEVQVRMGEEAELVKKQDSDLGITVQGEGEPLPRPPSPTRHKRRAPVAPHVQKKCNITEVKSSSDQKNSDETASNSDDTRPSARRKERKKKNNAKYPKELNSFAVSSSDEESSVLSVKTGKRETATASEKEVPAMS